jgi:flagellar basal-body rod protein FlgG
VIHALWTAATGMEAMKTKIDVIANNLANSNTDGFKRSVVEFNDLLYQYLRNPGFISGQQESPSGVGIGLGTQVSGTTVQHKQGSLQTTENNLDWAVDGIGMFQVRDPISGTNMYTRKGSFKLSPEGAIVTSEGLPLEPALTVPTDALAFQISADGFLLVQQPGQTGMQPVGQVQLARFPNSSGLQAKGAGLYVETSASGPPLIGPPKQQGLGQIVPRALESSNVQIVTEMVDLITTQKSFDTNSKVISVSDKMMDTANNLAR